MDLSDFSEFFRRIHGFDPFPWQRRLLSAVEKEGWPSALALPTSSGKTSVIDIFIFSMALHFASGKRSPRRLFYTVDRRFVVDEAYVNAMKLRESLLEAIDEESVVGQVARTLASSAVLEGSSPLEVVRMHGGIPHEPVFIKNPLQPTVILTTVDQIGSRLLFRGYGISEYMRPVHAAIVAKDSLIVIDEAHLSSPFLKTLHLVAKYQGDQWCETPVGSNVSFVSMSATHPGDSASLFQLDDADLADPVLSVRLKVSKPVKLVKLKENRESNMEQKMHFLAKEFAQRAHLALGRLENPAVSVVVNSVALANSIYAELLTDGSIDAFKIIGRIRPFERDRILNEVIPKISLQPGRKPRDKPIIVVSTQTIEVGANLDFDVMISEIAPLDALQQRFGRLNRVGSRSGAYGEIVYSPEREDVNSFIYGDAWRNTWKWLEEVKKDDEIDFGPNAVESIKQMRDVSNLMVSSVDPPLLMPSHLDMLAQTSPEPAFQPSVPLLLHGKAESNPDVQVIWRSDIPEDLGSSDEKGVWEAVSLIPPTSYEAAPVPIWAIRSFLDGMAIDFADAEGSELVETRPNRTDGRKAFIWNGMQGSKIASSREIGPGQTIIIPSVYGGYDGYGWNPKSKTPVTDVAEVAFRKVYGREVFRIHPAITRTWFDAPNSESIGECNRLIDSVITDFLSGEDFHEAVEECLRAMCELPGIREEVASALMEWAEAGMDRMEQAYPFNRPQGIILEKRMKKLAETTDEDDSSSYTGNVTLEDHSRGVEKYVRNFASHLELPGEIVSDLSLAGLLHDIGKADPRFQSWLLGGIPWSPENQILAKSYGSGGDLNAIVLSRERSGYPKGGRHECYSYSIVTSNPHLIEGRAHDPDLVRYLVGAHHGRGRALMPVVPDSGTSVKFNFLGEEVDFRGPHGLDKIDSDWPDLFWKLLRRYGYWGLPYMEMIVRLGDHRESEEEMINHGE